MALGGLVLESLLLYLKGMRILMFQLSGFYYKPETLRFHLCIQRSVDFVGATLGPLYSDPYSFGV